MRQFPLIVERQMPEPCGPSEGAPVSLAMGMPASRSFWICSAQSQEVSGYWVALSLALRTLASFSLRSSKRFTRDV
jgi:hypothetical protein